MHPTATVETTAQVLKGWFAHRSGRSVLGLALYTLAFALWVALAAEGSPNRIAISDLAFLPIGLAVGWLTWQVGANRALPGRVRLAWRMIGLALFAFWAGDVAWSYYEVGQGTDPFPSVADAGYLLFYPVVLIGLLTFPTAPRTPQGRLKFWLDLGTVIMGGWMVVWYFVLGPVAGTAEPDLLTTLLTTAYPIGDLALIFGVAAVLLGRPEGSSRTAIVLLGTGVASFLVADLSFGYLSILETYEGGTAPDIFWMLAQTLIAAGGQYQNYRADRKRVEPRPAEDVGTISPLPYAAVGLGYFLLFVAGRFAAPYPLGGLLYGAIVITVLVLIRQLTVMGENIQLLADMRALATVDGLTGLFNRRHFFVLAEREFDRYLRYRHPLSAIMIDIDNFKPVNDEYGHIAGDQVLRHVAEQCQEHLRKVDVVARYGGDEIVILLPETDLVGASQIAHRLVDAVTESPLAFGTDLLRVSLSAGVATADGSPDLNVLLRRADDALLLAKQGGRSLVVTAEPN